MGLALDELENSYEHVFKSNGIDIVFDPDVWSHVRYYPGFTIDYTSSLYGSGFVIDTGRSGRSYGTDC